MSLGSKSSVKYKKYFSDGEFNGDLTASEKKRFENSTVKHGK